MAPDVVLRYLECYDVEVVPLIGFLIQSIENCTSGNRTTGNRASRGPPVQ